MRRNKDKDKGKEDKVLVRYGQEMDDDFELIMLMHCTDVALVLSDYFGMDDHD